MFRQTSMSGKIRWFTQANMLIVSLGIIVCFLGHYRGKEKVGLEPALARERKEERRKREKG